MEEWDMSNQQDDKLKKSMTKDNGKKKTTTSKLPRFPEIPNDNYKLKSL